MSHAPPKPPTSPPAPDNEGTLALLRERHVFPGPFTFKAIGNPDDDFAGRARAAVAQVLVPQPVDAPLVRASAKGRHHSLTFSVQVQSPEQVLAVFAALKAVKGVSFVL